MDPAMWLSTVATGWNEMGHTAFWVALLKIMWINILLSGDNAVVIAMACRGLPPRQRLWGMILGAGVAVVLRIIFTVVVASLMLLPWLKIVGGLALFYIAAKLLVPEDPDESETEAAEHLWRAVRIVAVADIIMSLDNVIAIAAAAQGNMALLVIGLGISIPLIVVGAALIMALLDRFPILVWAGAALLGWIVGEVIATDPVIQDYLEPRLGPEGFHYVVLFAALVGAILVLVVGGLWRALPKASPAASAEEASAAAEKLTAALARRDEPDRPPRCADPDRRLRLPARLSLDLRARGRGARRAHHRPRAWRRGQRLHGGRDLRQGRPLRRARASSRPADQAARAQGRQGLAASSRRSPGTTRSISLPRTSCAPSSSTARRRSGPTTMPARWVSSCATASTGCATPRAIPASSRRSATTSAWTGYAAGTGQIAGPDPREMAKSDLVVIWGTNAVNTQVNVMTHAIRARKERGAKIVAVDVYMNGTMKQADLPVLIRPGTDGALACAVMHCLFRDGKADWDYLDRYTDAPRELAEHVRTRDPQWASRITGCPVETIEAFARLIGERKRAYFPPRLRLLTLAQRRRQHARGELHSGGHRRLAARRRRGAFFNNRAIYHWDKTMIEGLGSARSVDPPARSIAHRRGSDRRGGCAVGRPAGRRPC